jgi:hypothetical protein
LPRTLFLHIGPEKTGTSAIQHVLRYHDNSVVIYPKVGLWGDGSHHVLVSKFYKGYLREGGRRAKVNQLFREIASEAEHSELDVLISSELLALRKDVGAFINELIHSLGDVPINVEILLTCREHFERAASRYSQRLRRGDERDPDQFIRESAAELCYMPIVREMRKTNQKVVALNYHPAQDSVTRFLEYVGFARHEIPEPERRNVSLSAKAMVAKLAANRVLQNEFDKRKGSIRVIKKMTEFKGPSQFIFGPEAAAEAERVFSSDRDFLRDEYHLQFPVPKLETEKSKFFLDADEFAEISQIADEMGNDGAKIVEIMRGFVRA